MSEAVEALDRVTQALLPAGLESVEVYLKSGRSRRAELGAQGRLASLHRERGWAVRASGERASLFCCGSGELEASRAWPVPDGFPVRLPGPRPVTEWREPAEMKTPICVEHEALDMLEACNRELGRELGEARLLRAFLEDGESESRLANSRGIETGWRQRSATLFLEAALGRHRVVEYLGGRTTAEFNPKALARRIADRLVIRRDGVPGERDRGTVLLAPPVAVRVLIALLPLFFEEPRGSELGGALGSERLNVIDDARLDGGLFVAPVDGEGSPTGKVTLIENGILRARLGADSTAGRRGGVPGCVRRASYRDVPQVGPSHLFIEADPTQRVGALLAEVSRGYYFLDADGPGRFDLEQDHFEMKVAGFAVRSGAPIATLAGAQLSGRISRLLTGIEAVARDLTFFPHAALVGAPSLLVSGLDLNSKARL